MKKKFLSIFAIQMCSMLALGMASHDGKIEQQSGVSEGSAEKFSSFYRANPHLLEDHDWDGSTPLHDAVFQENQSKVLALLELGANRNAALTCNGFTPLHMAISRNNEALVMLLLEKDANIDAQDRRGNTPLHMAISSNSEALVMLLLEKDANIDAQDNSGVTPLNRAVCKKNESLARLLLDQGANIDAQDYLGDTPLNWAVRNENESLAESLARLLLDQGANIDVQDGNGKTHLIWAVKESNMSMVRLLLDKGANMEARDWSGHNPLQIAIVYGVNLKINPLIILLLLNKKLNFSSAELIAFTGSGVVLCAGLYKLGFLPNAILGVVPCALACAWWYTSMH